MHAISPVRLSGGVKARVDNELAAFKKDRHMERGTSRLSAREIDKRIRRLDGWKLKRGRLHRELKFSTFAHAFGFMTSVAIVAQAMDHHPDWSNSYRRVTIDLISHDVEGLSARDFDLAEQINAVAAPLLGFASD